MAVQYIYIYSPRKPEIHITNWLTAERSTSPSLFAPIIASYGLDTDLDQNVSIIIIMNIPRHNFGHYTLKIISQFQNDQKRVFTKVN